MESTFKFKSPPKVETLKILQLSQSIVSDTQASILQVDTEELLQSPPKKIVLRYDDDQDDIAPFTATPTQPTQKWEETQVVQSIDPRLPHLGDDDADVRLLEQQIQRNISNGKVQVTDKDDPVVEQDFDKSIEIISVSKKRDLNDEIVVVDNDTSLCEDETSMLFEDEVEAVQEDTSMLFGEEQQKLVAESDDKRVIETDSDSEMEQVEGGSSPNLMELTVPQSPPPFDLTVVLEPQSPAHIDLAPSEPIILTDGLVEEGKVALTERLDEQPLVINDQVIPNSIEVVKDSTVAEIPTLVNDVEVSALAVIPNSNSSVKDSTEELIPNSNVRAKDSTEEVIVTKSNSKPTKLRHPQVAVVVRRFRDTVSDSQDVLVNSLQSLEDKGLEVVEREGMKVDFGSPKVVPDSNQVDPMLLDDGFEQHLRVDVHSSKESDDPLCSMNDEPEDVNLDDFTTPASNKRKRAAFIEVNSEESEEGENQESVLRKRDLKRPRPSFKKVVDSEESEQDDNQNQEPIVHTKGQTKRPLPNFVSNIEKDIDSVEESEQDENQEPTSSERRQIKRSRPSFVKAGSDESSTEPDNSNDDDYQPTQKSRVSLGKVKVPKTPKTTPKNTPKSTAKSKKTKQYFWTKLVDSQFLIPYTPPEGVFSVNQIDTSKLLPVHIQPGQKYLYKNTMTTVTVDEIIKVNAAYKVRKEGSRPFRVELEDLLLVPEVAAMEENLPDLSRFGIILSLSTQTMSQKGNSEDPDDRWVNDKEFITQKILNAKGRVLGSLLEHYKGRERVTQDPEEFVLVTHKPLRTKKFLLALGYGIPIVSVKWLKESFRKGRVLGKEGFIIPTGESLYINGPAYGISCPSGVFNGKTFYSNRQLI